MCATQLNSDQKLDTLKFISQTQRALHEQRQKHELKAFFTTATLFVLIGAAPYTGQSVLPSPLPMLLAIVIFLVILLIALVANIYLNGIHRANIVNKTFAQDAEDHIMKLLRENGINIPAPENAEKHHVFTRLWQPVVLWILGIAAAFLVMLS